MTPSTSIVMHIAWTLFCLFSFSFAQAGPNTIAVYNRQIRTFSLNSTTFIVPIKKTALQGLVPYPLLTPKGFDADEHPILINSGFLFDIRRGALEIDSLMGSNIYVPYTDRLKNGKTPFKYPIVSYIGSTPNQYLGSVIPAVVGTVVGSTSFIANLLPNTGPYTRIDTDEYSAQTKQVIVPNPVSGPGVTPSAIDLDFFSASAHERPFTAKDFIGMMNQVTIQNNGMCQRDNYYFNQTFTEPVFRTGTVTLYAPTIPSAIAGLFKNVAGYSANSEGVGYNAETCATAAKRNRPMPSS